MRTFAMVAALVFVAGQAFAQTAPSQTEANQKALEQTQKLLKDNAARNSAIQNDANAKAADQQAAALAGNPQNKQKMYEISADIMQQLVLQSNGDPAKMQELVKAAQRDPAKFLQSLSPEQRAAIEALARDVSSQRQSDASKGSR